MAYATSSRPTMWRFLPLALALASCGEQQDAQPQETAAPQSTQAASAEQTAAVADGADGDNEASRDGGGNGGNGGAFTRNGDSGNDNADSGRSSSEMSWLFSRSAAGPKLVYGEPQTDNTRIMLRCGSGNSIAVSFMRPHAQGGASEFTIRSGGASRTVSASVSRSQLSGLLVQADVPQNAAPLQRFRNGAALQVLWGQDRIELPSAGNRADRFFAAC